MLRTMLIFVGVISLFVNLYWLILYYSYRKRVGDGRISSSKKFVSILVPSHNDEICVGDCLKSLSDRDYDKKLMQVIVVDDGSSDKTLEIASSFAKTHSFVKVIHNPKNSGKKSKALNIGLSKLSKKTEIVVVLDADSMVYPKTLKQVLTFFDEGYDAVSMRYMPWNRKHWLARLQVFEYMYAVLWRKILSLLDSMYVTPGVFSAYSYRALKKVHFFNENCFSEDMELALRLQKAGYKIGYSFSTTAFTHVPTKMRAFIHQRERWYRGYIDSIRRHKDIIFNPELGNFGMIMMPLNILSSLLVIAVSALFASTVFSFVKSFFSWVYKLYLIHFDISYYISSINLSFPDIENIVRHSLLSLDMFSFIAIFSFIMALIMLVIIKRRTNEVHGADLIYFPVFLFAYLPLNSVIWLYSLLLEVFGAGKKW